MKRLSIHDKALCAALVLSAMACVIDKKPDAKKASNGGTDQQPQGSTDGIPEQTLDDYLRSCGVDPAKLKDDNAVLFQQNLVGLTKRITGTKFIVNYVVDVMPSIAILSKTGLSSQTTDVRVQANSLIAQNFAEKEVAPMRGETRTKGLSQQAFTDLKGKNQQWSTIICTTSPSSESVAPNGLSLKYDPGMPGAVSPLAPLNIYEKELGNGKDFDVKVTVTAPGSTKFTVNQTFTGRVSIRKLPPVISVVDDVSGQSRTINADIAYQVETSMGSDEITKSLGFTPKKDLYISVQRKQFVLIVARSGNPSYDPIFFVPAM